MSGNLRFPSGSGWWCALGATMALALIAPPAKAAPDRTPVKGSILHHSLAATRTAQRPVLQPRQAVRLVITGASALRETADVVFHCEALLINGTGRALSVSSNFYSAFDGLSIVVLNAKGKQLALQSYLHHQSPYSPTPREFRLNRGRNAQTLAFPIAGIPAATRVVRVLLVGTLPGSGYRGLLRSHSVHVTIKNRD